MSGVKKWFEQSLEEMQHPGPPPEPEYKKITVRVEVEVCEKLDEIARRLGPVTRTKTAEELLTVAILEAYELVAADEWLMSSESVGLEMDVIEAIVHPQEGDHVYAPGDILQLPHEDHPASLMMPKNRRKAVAQSEQAEQEVSA